MGRIFAIGDIHGHLKVLDRLLARIPFGPEDTLVFLGDYVDRGPDSRGVLDRVIGLKEKMEDRCVCILGNHEDMMLDHWRRTRGGWFDDICLVSGLAYVLDYGRGFWLSVGGDATIHSYFPDDVSEQHIRFLASLPVIYRDGDYAFAHAGIRPIGHTPRAEALWGAQGFTLDSTVERVADHANGETVVVGHFVVNQPIVGPSFIAIDTGCAFGGCLTAVQLPEIVFYQEPSL